MTASELIPNFIASEPERSLHIVFFFEEPSMHEVYSAYASNSETWPRFYLSGPYSSLSVKDWHFAVGANYELYITVFPEEVRTEQKGKKSR